MNHTLPNGDSPAVDRAIARVAALRPAYTAILNFYGPVFRAQIEAEAETAPSAIEVDAALLEMKSAEGFALIEPTAFTIDLPAAGKLLTTICRIAAMSSEKLGGAGEALMGAMNGGLDVGDLFADVLDDGHRIGGLAEQLAVPAQMLSLLFYLAAKPSIEKGAREMARRLPDHPEVRGTCPVCGSAPIIGELDPDGKQWLHCGLCWHRWPVARLCCPFCQNRDSASLEYVYSDDEPEYRVNLCGRCKRYVKVADVRKMERPFYAPLEQVASLHLDMLVAERGYRHAVVAE